MNRARLILCTILVIPSLAWSQIYVATNGSDNNDGTRSHPFASAGMAVRKAREMRRLNDTSMKHGIEIIVENGTYQFSEPLFIRPEDSGTEDGPTTIKAAEGAHPVFTGGVTVKGWVKLQSTIVGLPSSAKGKIWVADVPLFEGNFIPFRQLWVNGRKAVRAKAQKGDTMSRILSWDRQSQTCWIPKPKGIDFSSVKGVEMFLHQWWEIAILRIRSMKIVGDSIQLRFYQPESRIESEHPWPAPWISNETGNSAFYLTNALQFLDEPGEWYLDQSIRKVYYYPRSNENMSTVSVVAPFLETLVKIEGTIDRPVSNFSFQGIYFQHAGWLRPSQQGHVPLQAGMYLLDAYKLRPAGTPNKKTLENQAWVGRPAGAVEISYASAVNFEDCRFEHLASTALDYQKGTRNSLVKGNLFRDVGGTAILCGVFSDEAMEAHLPYNPSDKKEITENMTISNNLIHDVGNEDWGCVGIGGGFVRNTTITHNDISDIPYSGISLGWGWTPERNMMENNSVVANKIHRYARQMYDVAGIYTLSAQPGTTISENDVDSIYKAPYAHLPYHWFYLYSDEGTSGVTVRNNWTPSEKYLQNANGSGNLWEHNGPLVNDSIRRNAGLQRQYRYLLSEKNSFNPKWKINHEQPVVIELVSQKGQSIDIPKLKTVLQENHIDTNSIYQWQNHYVIFASVGDASGLRKKVEKAIPSVGSRVYYDPFYEFLRQHCSDTATAREWDHIILTANLVADPKLQKEYLDYHATQFEKWPEVSKGFCQANFQRLLVYKSGRQLMLVISIPKGESLDKLNPKTTENNPRVNEWNKIMARYQEGIEGTKPGEVWVFFKQIK
ncbi:MAG: L-rhamnose mutarotase [Flavisolibacter sp.]